MTQQRVDLSRGLFTMEEPWKGVASLLHVFLVETLTPTSQPGSTRSTSGRLNTGKGPVLHVTAILSSSSDSSKHKRCHAIGLSDHLSAVMAALQPVVLIGIKQC